MKLFLVGVEVAVKGRPDIKLREPRLRVNILAHSEEEARWRGEAHVRASLGKNLPLPDICTYTAFHASGILDQNEEPHILWEDDDANVC